MRKPRRDFIQKTGVFSVGALTLPYLACHSSEHTATQPFKKDVFNFGIQLYTLRDDMPKNPKKVLAQLAEFGYTQIESYEGDQGIYWNMKPKEFTLFLNDLGLDMVSAHCNVFEGFEYKVAQAAEVGIQYLICPWLDAPQTKSGWQTIANQFNECGETCRKHGLKFAYHNHGYPFVKVDDIIPMDFLMNNTNPDLVDFELDLYWVVTAKADPIEYLKKYKNRFRLCHIKDRLKSVAPEIQEASCDLGSGSIDYPNILNVAAQNGMQFYILEQERYDTSTPMECAKIGATYLKNLSIT